MGNPILQKYSVDIEIGLWKLACHAPFVGILTMMTLIQYKSTASYLQYISMLVYRVYPLTATAAGCIQPPSSSAVTGLVLCNIMLVCHVVVQWIMKLINRCLWRLLIQEHNHFFWSYGNPYPWVSMIFMKSFCSYMNCHQIYIGQIFRYSFCKLFFIG